MRRHGLFHTVAVVVLLATIILPPAVHGASHREAPLIALDPSADLTDVYAFRSWENAGKAVFIMNVIPAQVPASGPNYFNLDDHVLYEFHFDLDQDGRADDLTIQFRFDDGDPRQLQPRRAQFQGRTDLVRGRAPDHGALRARVRGARTPAAV